MVEFSNSEKIRRVELHEEFLTLNDRQSSSRPVDSINMIKLFVRIKSERANLNCRVVRTCACHGNPIHGLPDP